MTRRPLQIRDATVLVTGASSGIGRALALQLASRGARLVLAARRTDLLDELACQVADTGDPAPVVVGVDLAQRGAPAELARTALDASGGRLDVVVNNAGASLTDAQVSCADSDDARAVFET